MKYYYFNAILPLRLSTLEHCVILYDMLLQIPLETTSELIKIRTSVEGQLIRFCCFIIIQSPYRDTRLAVVLQHVVGVVPLLGLVVKWIRFLRAVAETSNV